MGLWWVFLGVGVGMSVGNKGNKGNKGKYNTFSWGRGSWYVGLRGEQGRDMWGTMVVVPLYM